MFGSSASGGPLVSLLLSLADTVDGLHGHERSARLRRTRSGFLTVFKMDHPLPDVRVGRFDDEIFCAFVSHDPYVARLDGLSMAELKTDRPKLQFWVLAEIGHLAEKTRPA